MKRVDAFDIPDLVEGIKGAVGHAKLFALIYIGRSLHHVKAGRQHLGACFTKGRGVVSKAGYAAGLVMISQKQAVPGQALQFGLPFAHDLTEALEICAAVRPFSVFSVVQSHMLKLEHHVQFLSIRPGVLFGFFNGDAGALPYCHQIIAGQYFPVHFLKVFVYMGAVHASGKGIGGSGIEFAVRKSGLLGDHADHIHTEAVDALFTPPVHHGEDIPAYRRIIPVQVGLFFGKKMQVVHVRGLIVFPCGAGKAASPVIRLFSVFTFSPEIIVPVGIVL